MELEDFEVVKTIQKNGKLYVESETYNRLYELAYNLRKKSKRARRNSEKDR